MVDRPSSFAASPVHGDQDDHALAHPNARVRALAREIQDEQRRAAEEMKRLREQEEERLEEPTAGPDAPDDDPGARDVNPDDDIPL